MTHPYQEMELFARQALGLREEVTFHMLPVGKGGSIRSFHRIRYRDNSSAVFMQYDRGNKENTCYAAIAGFLRNIDVPAPLIIAHDPHRGFIVMEDLGDSDLWSFRYEPWAVKSAYYRKTLTIAHRLHFFPVEEFPSRKVPLMERFSPDLYRWERNYFRENFVQDVCGIELSPSDRDELEDELKSLSDRLENIKPCLVHRDIQSQNVMICKGEPVLIDFQGMRFGNLFYDLGSLLYDPYVFFTDDERLELLRYYYLLWILGRNEIHNVQEGRVTLSLTWMYFLDMFLDASAQRLMQALGAYGFLGLKRGISEFLNYIPNGVANLIDATTRAKHLPLLKNLALNCQNALKSQESTHR
jgi:aminoglycoside/choline kinase family phosphotransferase